MCCLATAAASETRVFPAEKRGRKVPEWTMRWSRHYLSYTPVGGFQSRPPTSWHRRAAIITLFYHSGKEKCTGGPPVLKVRCRVEMCLTAGVSPLLLIPPLQACEPRAVCKSSYISECASAFREPAPPVPPLCVSLFWQQTPLGCRARFKYL